ncbi:GNAT family N-acetyltransferase [Altererythrobacter rubellus]|jgi:GNAT superfamily N-acetyltransferase|uniref:GNAT family N-acetyltransferase n=1 Tax=Altererythrobacter rubellus TaxID=2173831 RepID=A0A9Y2F4V2_9SPHN|nr:GNAT family N-acetyltransferase [Altererythrobacter rubellus]WIW95483.1 GNAT family N-acetyltransferase [Altererythrobacter rubellus]
MTGRDWTLRLARPDDAESMPAIERAAAEKFRGVRDLINVDFDDVWEPDELRPLIRKGHCLVAHVGEEMAGFLVNQPFSRELHIWEMDVHPDYQGRGIGAGLIRACQIDAHNAGFKAVTLTTFRDVPWNGPFYARLGFEEVTALDAHPRLASELALEVDNGLPADRRCAMIHFLG